MSTYKVGYLVGSLARGSINRKLALALAACAAGTGTRGNRDRRLPLYSYDYDADYPEVARRFKQAIADVGSRSCS